MDTNLGFAGYAGVAAMHGGEARYAGMVTGVGPMVEPESVVAKALENLKAEINGLSVTADNLISRLGVVSRPIGGMLSGEAKGAPDPVTSLTTKRIDDQAKRIRATTDHLRAAMDALEI